MSDPTPGTMTTYTGRRGNTITVGDYLRDRRDHNTRTLRIDSLLPTGYRGEIRAACTVVGVDSVAITKTRVTDIAAATLAGPQFLPATAPETEGAVPHA